jgi:hypothetical protein
MNAEMETLHYRLNETAVRIASMEMNGSTQKHRTDLNVGGDC